METGQISWKSLGLMRTCQLFKRPSRRSLSGAGSNPCSILRDGAIVRPKVQRICRKNSLSATAPAVHYPLAFEQDENAGDESQKPQDNAQTVKGQAEERHQSP